MFAYDFLKENPQSRDKLIKDDWVTLSRIAPPMVLKELKDLTKLNVPLSDAVLFWHKEWLLREVMRVDDKHPDEFQIVIWRSKYIEQTYNLIQRLDVLVDNAYTFLIHIPEWFIGLNITDKELLDILNCMTRTNINADLMNAVNILFNLRCNVKNVHLSVNVKSRLLDVCTPHLLASFESSEQLHKVSDLLSDIPASEQKKYKSINEIEAHHDRLAEEKVQKLLKERVVRRYTYNRTFAQCAEECGLRLPQSEADLVRRGAQHNNCVGTYNSRHTCNNFNEEGTLSYHSVELTRVMFTDEATVDMSFYLRHGRIISTTVKQYKGKYNKDLPIPETLSWFQGRITGELSDILYIEVEVVQDDQDKAV
jgi:hypothetical protein